MTKTTQRALLLTAALGLTACAREPRLYPAPEATDVTAPGHAAVAVDEDVQLTAQVQAWDGQPRDLAELMTPMRVEIRNGSSRPIRIRHQEFTLIEADGTRLSAVPPYNIDQEVVRTVTPVYPVDDFYLAPYLDDYYDIDLYEETFPYDEFYYGRHYPDYRTIRIGLPTDQMVRFSLPEGVLRPGGGVAGFLYFEALDNDTNRARLQLELVNARTGEYFGRVEIPFVVR